VSLSGAGTLEESASLKLTLRGAVAAQAGRPCGPRIRRMVIQSRREKVVVGPEEALALDGSEPGSKRRGRARR
jgi:hypothetical protein